MSSLLRSGVIVSLKRRGYHCNKPLAKMLDEIKVRINIGYYPLEHAWYIETDAGTVRDKEITYCVYKAIAALLKMKLAEVKDGKLIFF